MNLPTKTIQDIRDLAPCYDPAEYLPKDWQGTALDVLGVAACPVRDRLWVVWPLLLARLAEYHPGPSSTRWRLGSNRRMGVLQ